LACDFKEEHEELMNPEQTQSFSNDDSLIWSFTIDDQEQEQKIDEDHFQLLKSNPVLCKLVKSVLHWSWSNSPKKIR